MNRRELFSTFVGKRGVPAPPQGLTCRTHYPNAVLRTHDNKAVKFYDDLIRNKQVIINLMYASCTSSCPLVTSKLIKVHQALKDRMGKDLFMYSITLKPEQDDPAALKRFAEMHKALLPGWTFLTGDPYDLETIRFKLFQYGHLAIDLDQSFHISMLRIINDATNRWTMVSPGISLFTILKHISWTDPPRSLEERLAENRLLQEKINHEIKLYGYRRIV